jgi:hypothetical protein
MPAPLGQIRYLTIHCAATPEGRDVKAETISDWDRRKFGQVSYHYVIELDGSVHETLSDTLKGPMSAGPTPATSGSAMSAASTRRASRRIPAPRPRPLPCASWSRPIARAFPT